MKQHQKLAAEGNNLLPLVLAGIGSVAVVLLFMESWFQVTKSPFTFLDMAHQYGFLADYKVSDQPNRGVWHLTGWAGSACFILMMLYSFRKHFKFMTDLGPIRYWLDVHMFLGIMGCALVTVHSTYRFGGIVSLSYWSAILVAVSGFLGRYLYVQIPRSIYGQELKMEEINEIMDDINKEMDGYAKGEYEVQHYFERIAGGGTGGASGAASALWALFTTDMKNFITLAGVRRDLDKNEKIPANVKARLLKLIREKGELVRSIRFLEASHRLLHYWHVFHKPFAIIMFIVMFLHVAVYYFFRV